MGYFTTPFDIINISSIKFGITHYGSGFLIPVLLPVCALMTGYCASAMAASSRPSLDVANNAYYQINLDLSHRLYTAVSENKNTPDKDKVTALQNLALQDWLFYRDYQSAQALLNKADTLGIKRAATWRMCSRIEREAGHYPEAQASARKALALAESAVDTQDANIEYARAVHDQALQNLKDKSPLDRDLLVTASRELCAILAKEPGQLSFSELLLGISLLLDDGPNTLAAWRSYYWINANDTSQGNLAEPGKALATLLPEWNGRPLSKAERVGLVVALAQSRFYEYAALMATDPRIGEADQVQDLPQVREIILYREFLRNVKKETEAFYRKTAVKRGGGGFLPAFITQFGDGFGRTLKNEEKGFWGKLSFPGERPHFSTARFKKEMEKRFGLVWNQGEANGYNGLLSGHIISDEIKSIEQYSYKATVRYVVLDRFVSAGYSSWFWDYNSNIGGWSSKDGIFSFREFSIQVPSAHWKMVNDPQQHAETERYIEERKAIEDSLTRRNPYAYLPGLRKRLLYKSCTRIYSALRSQGLERRDLCLAFLDMVYKDHEASSINAHEGRHTIDQRFFPIKFYLGGGAGREFRAKLSEVVFAPNPQLAFCNLIGPSIGDKSSHGQADEQIMKVVVAWMGKHLNDIQGVDRNRPLLPQFDLLTDDQICEILQSADPLAKRK